MADESAGITTNGKLSYMQIPAVDAEVSAAFYTDVFGWEVRGAPEHRSFTDASGELIGAFMTSSEEDHRIISAEPGILPYIYVTGIDAAVERITSHGGVIVRAPYPEGDLWVATFRDPAGNVIGIWHIGPR